MKLGEHVRGVCEPVCGEPCGVVWRIAPPLNEILDTTATTPVIDDRLHLILHVIINCDGGRGRNMGAEGRGGMKWSEELRVDNRVGADCGGKREAICVGGCALGDSKGTNKAGGKLAGGAIAISSRREQLG